MALLFGNYHHLILDLDVFIQTLGTVLLVFNSHCFKVNLLSNLLHTPVRIAAAPLSTVPPSSMGAGSGLA